MNVPVRLVALELTNGVHKVLAGLAANNICVFFIVSARFAFVYHKFVSIATEVELVVI